MRQNSRQHNQWCEQFVEWTIQQAEDRGIRTCLFLGDWSHNRNSVNVSTLNYSHSGLRMLSERFDHVIMLLGNHDLYFRDKLEIHSIPYAQDFHNVRVIDTITEMDNFCFVPWLVGDQWQAIPKIRKPYMFCHAEIAKFRMNAMVEMPDHGALTADSFGNQQLVFSGHFHKRQRKGNIQYIGNAFPHNFADSGDDERGVMYWRPGQEPEFESWPGAPRYRNLNLSSVLLDPSTYIDNQTFARINVDADLNYEDMVFVRELLEGQLGALDISFEHRSKDTDDIDVDDTEINFESVDSIVIGHLQSIDSTSMNTATLIDIYQSL